MDTPAENKFTALLLAVLVVIAFLTVHDVLFGYADPRPPLERVLVTSSGFAVSEARFNGVKYPTRVLSPACEPLIYRQLLRCAKIPSASTIHYDLLLSPMAGSSYPNAILRYNMRYGLVLDKGEAMTAPVEFQEWARRHFLPSD